LNKNMFNWTGRTEVDVLVDTHLLLERTQKRHLRALAAERECSLALLVRSAVDHYLQVAAGPSAERSRRIALHALGSLPPLDDPEPDEYRW
jgi:hypothetical protein